MKRALTKVDGIVDIETDTSNNSCKFSAPAGLDIEKTLNEIAEGGNKHIKDWALAK